MQRASGDAQPPALAGWGERDVIPSLHVGPSSLPPSLLYERCDVGKEIEKVRIHLVRLDAHAETLFEEDDQLNGCNGVEDAAGDQRRVVAERVRVLTGKKLREYVVLDTAPDVRFCCRFHSGSVTV